MTTPSIARINVNAPAIRMLSVTEVEGYLISARGLLPSLKLLCEAGNDHLRGGAMITGFILECSLKAFIVAAEKEKPNCKPLKEHDLEKYWRIAVDCGLPIELLPPQWCVALNSLHFKNMSPDAHGGLYAVRYQSGNHGLVFPVTADMLSGVGEVFAKVEHALKQN